MAPQKTFGSTIHSLIILGLLIGGPLAAVLEAGAGGCDEAALEEAKLEFLRLRRVRIRQPERVTEQKFRNASNAYIAQAEACYESKFGDSIPKSQLIDEGGLWFPDPASHELRAARRYAPGQPGTRPIPDEHNLFGHKWGAGSPFLPPPDNPNAVGPRLPGGTITYSFMADGIDLSAEGGGTSTAITSLATFQDCLLEEISNAFGAWSAVADIEFIPVTDSGAPFNDPSGASGDIRICAHPFDGASGILAHAYFPPPNGATAAGDLHFDSAEAWYCDPTLGAIDFGLVAIHEIGHSIGLNHEGSDAALMEPFYNPAYTFGPLADDIIGAGEIYGGSPVGNGFFFGDVGIGTDQPLSALHILRDDGTARIRVDDNGSPSNRLLVVLENNGSPQLSFRNTNVGSEWLMNSSGNDFQFRRVGTSTQLRMYGSGRLRVFNSAGATPFDLLSNGNLTITGNLTANGIFYPSDRNLKENILAVDAGDILNRLVDLPVYRWNFRSDPQGIPHIGPMAQDFHALFDVGPDERHVNPMDVAGVSLAAVQALQRELEAQKVEIESLRNRLDEALLLLEKTGRQ